MGSVTSYQKDPRILLVTGCDEWHFDLAADCIASFHANYPSACDVGFINFGRKTPPHEIAAHVTHYLPLRAPAEFSKNMGYYTAFSGAKAKLPELFPGYEVYIWVDTDCWFQGADSLPRIIAQARTHDIAIHPEFDVHYINYPTPSKRTLNIYRRNEGEDLSNMPLNMPMLNAGVFAMRATSPIWAAWQQELQALRDKQAQGQKIYFSDQIPLHKIIYKMQFDIGPLRAIDNWQTYICFPGVDLRTKKLIVPTPPHEVIGIIHLAGSTKFETVTMNGHSFGLRYRDFQRLAREVI